MPVQVMALLTVNEDAPESLAEYFSTTLPLIDAAGARIVQRFTINEVVVGHRSPRTLVLVEYPSREALDSVFNSAEYEAIKQVRDEAFLSYEIAIIENECESDLSRA